MLSFRQAATFVGVMKLSGGSLVIHGWHSRNVALVVELANTQLGLGGSNEQGNLMACPRAWTLVGVEGVDAGAHGDSILEAVLLSLSFVRPSSCI